MNREFYENYLRSKNIEIFENDGMLTLRRMGCDLTCKRLPASELSAFVSGYLFRDAQLAEMGLNLEQDHDGVDAFPTRIRPLQ